MKKKKHSVHTFVGTIFHGLAKTNQSITHFFLSGGGQHFDLRMKQVLCFKRSTAKSICHHECTEEVMCCNTLYKLRLLQQWMGLHILWEMNDIQLVHSNEDGHRAAVKRLSTKTHSRSPTSKILTSLRIVPSVSFTYATAVQCVTHVCSPGQGGHWQPG